MILGKAVFHLNKIQLDIKGSLRVFFFQPFSNALSNPFCPRFTILFILLSGDEGRLFTIIWKLVDNFLLDDFPEVRSQIPVLRIRKVKRGEEFKPRITSNFQLAFVEL